MLQEKYAIGLTGLTGAGKGEVSRILYEQHGFAQVSLGSVLQEVAEEYYGSIDRTALERVYKELGETVLADRIVFLAEQSRNDRIVIDSIRSVNLLDSIQNAFDPNFAFIGVAATRSERYARTLGRERPGDPSCWADFVQLDLLQLGDVASELLGYQVRQCFCRADIIIRNNSSSFENLETKVTKFLDMLGIIVHSQ